MMRFSCQLEFRNGVNASRIFVSSQVPEFKARLSAKFIIHLPRTDSTLELGSFKLSPAANDTNGDEDTPKALLTNVFLKNQGARTLSTLNKVPECQQKRKN